MAHRADPASPLGSRACSGLSGSVHWVSSAPTVSAFGSSPVVSPTSCAHSPLRPPCSLPSTLNTTPLSVAERCDAELSGAQQIIAEQDAELEQLKENMASYRRSESRMAELVLKLQQQQKNEKDNSIAEREELERVYREGLEERDRQYQRELEERDLLYQNDLEERDRQYQQDLEKLRSAIDDVREQQEAQQTDIDIGATWREGTLQGHVDATACSKLSVENLDEMIRAQDDQLKKFEELASTQAARITELEAERLRPDSPTWSPSEANIEELQQLAVSQATRIAELEEQVDPQGRGIQDGHACSEMEARLGKLLELAAARITELEGQNELYKAESDADVAGMNKHLRELKDVAVAQATRIIELEAQGKLGYALNGFNGVDKQQQHQAAAKEDAENVGMAPVSCVNSNTLPDSETSTATGSAEIPGSGPLTCNGATWNNFPTMTMMPQAKYRQQSPIPHERASHVPSIKVGGSVWFSSPTSGDGRGIAPAITADRVASRREASPVRHETRRAVSPTRHTHATPLMCPRTAQTFCDGNSVALQGMDTMAYTGVPVQQIVGAPTLMQQVTCAGQPTPAFRNPQVAFNRATARRSQSPRAPPQAHTWSNGLPHQAFSVAESGGSALIPVAKARMVVGDADNQKGKNLVHL